MKSYLFLLIISIIVFGEKGYAQSKKDSSRIRYEVGVSLPWYLLLSKHPIYSFSQGVYFKVEKNKNVLRTGIRSHFPIRNIDFSRSYNYNLNIGYERRFFNRKFQLFAGADLFYQQYKINYNLVESEKFQHFGMGPNLGVLYKPIDRISIQLENVLYVGPGKIQYKNINDNHTKTGTFTYGNLLSLNVFYRF
ncbi:MAG: hypothetical protein ACXWDO_05795 [Bacteroidia bacterium]